MLDTALNGEKVFKCDNCHGEIECCGFVVESAGDLGDMHFCDECACELRISGREFRICDECGELMTEGYCSEDGGIHLCESCFGPWMDENCPDGWRVNEHADATLWDGGFYDERIDGEWLDTGIFWTQWY